MKKVFYRFVLLFSFIFCSSINAGIGLPLGSLGMLGAGKEAVRIRRVLSATLANADVAIALLEIFLIIAIILIAIASFVWMRATFRNRYKNRLVRLLYSFKLCRMNSNPTKEIEGYIDQMLNTHFFKSAIKEYYRAAIVNSFAKLKSGEVANEKKLEVISSLIDFVRAL